MVSLQVKLGCDYNAEKSLVTSRADWFLFPDTTKLALCNKTMLLDMVVKSASASEIISPVVRACSADLNTDNKAAFEADDGKASLCTTANRVLERTSVYLHQPQVADSKDFSVNHVLSASQQVKSHLALQEPSCTNNAMEFAYSQSSIFGLFSGAEVHQHGITQDILERFMTYAHETSLTKTTIVQVGACPAGAESRFANITTS